MTVYSDISVPSSDDLALDANGQAVIITDRDVIAQDLIHAIRESGYLPQLVAERNAERRQLLIQKIILLVEDDARIIPGTVTMTGNAPTETGEWTWDLLADTYDFGNLKLSTGATA